MTDSGIELGTTITTVIWTVKPGNEDAFVEAWNAFARRTAEHQEGAMTVVLLRDADEPARFVSSGPWRDRESAEAWRKTPRFQELFARFREFCSAIEPHIMVCVATNASSP